MKVDLILSNARVYDVTRMEIKKGDRFQLVADGPGKWLIDNDPVLNTDAPKDNGISGVAEEVGTSDIWIFDDNKQILKEIKISVVAAIVPQATALNLTAK